MLLKAFQNITVERFSNIRFLCLIVLIGLFVDIQICVANGQHLILRDMTITTLETFSANNSITVGPNFTISSSGEVILGAPTVSMSGAVHIIEGGHTGSYFSCHSNECEERVLYNPERICVTPELPQSI